ncbi:MAG: hypothetical protein EB084_15065 [Proteobacteria bacterium]|nr:hypothetical protein [Pseudomonadota bacterium]
MRVRLPVLGEKTCQTHAFNERGIDEVRGVGTALLRDKVSDAGWNRLDVRPRDVLQTVAQGH